MAPPLHKGCGDEKKLEVTKSLIENSANVNANKDNEGTTPLHWTCKWGQMAAARLLIENGADVNARQNDGTTPMHDGAYRRKVHLDILKKMLIEDGADVNAKTTYGWTPLHIMFYANGGGLLESAELVIQNGADLNARDSEGKTPLHLACEWGCVKGVQL